MTVRPHVALGLAFGLFAATTAVTPAFAQVAPTAPSKTEAILGAPSALAAILAAQAGGSPTPTAVTTTFTATVTPAIATPLAAAFQPAVPVAPAPASDRPNVFNSIAIPIAQTSLDQRWRGATTAPLHGRGATFAAALRAASAQHRLEAVNAFVNANVRFVDDSSDGAGDRWSAASDTLARGRGDCEDYAIAKLALLKRAGFADKDLYLVVLKDLVRHADHAVLVVRSEGRLLVLDNGGNKILESAEIRDYRPIFTFTAGRRFTHGYRRVTPTLAIAPVILASVETGPAMSSLSGLPSSTFARR